MWTPVRAVPVGAMGWEVVGGGDGSAQGMLRSRAAIGACRELPCVRSHPENGFSQLDCKGNFIMQKKCQVYMCRHLWHRTQSRITLQKNLG